MNKKKSPEVMREPWQIEDDANLMRRYHEVMSDKTRLRDATKHLKKQAENLNKILKKTTGK